MGGKNGPDNQSPESSQPTLTDSSLEETESTSVSNEPSLWTQGGSNPVQTMTVVMRQLYRCKNVIYVSLLCSLGAFIALGVCRPLYVFYTNHHLPFTKADMHYERSVLAGHSELLFAKVKQAHSQYTWSLSQADLTKYEGIRQSLLLFLPHANLMNATKGVLKVGHLPESPETNIHLEAANREVKKWVDLADEHVRMARDVDTSMQVAADVSRRIGMFLAEPEFEAFNLLHTLVQEQVEVMQSRSNLAAMTVLNHLDLEVYGVQSMFYNAVLEESSDASLVPLLDAKMVTVANLFQQTPFGSAVRNFLTDFESNMRSLTVKFTSLLFFIRTAEVQLNGVVTPQRDRLLERFVEFSEELYNVEPLSSLEQARLGDHAGFSNIASSDRAGDRDIVETHPYAAVLVVFVTILVISFSLPRFVGMDVRHFVFCCFTFLMISVVGCAVITRVMKDSLDKEDQLTRFALFEYESLRLVSQKGILLATCWTLFDKHLAFGTEMARIEYENCFTKASTTFRDEILRHRAQRRVLANQYPGLYATDNGTQVFDETLEERAFSDTMLRAELFKMDELHRVSSLRRNVVLKPQGALLDLFKELQESNAEKGAVLKNDAGHLEHTIASKLFDPGHEQVYLARFGGDTAQLDKARDGILVAAYQLMSLREMIPMSFVARGLIFCKGGGTESFEAVKQAQLNTTTMKGRDVMNPLRFISESNTRNSDTIVSNAPPATDGTTPADTQPTATTRVSQYGSVTTGIRGEARLKQFITHHRKLSMRFCDMVISFAGARKAPGSNHVVPEPGVTVLGMSKGANLMAEFLTVAEAEADLAERSDKWWESLASLGKKAEKASDARPMLAMVKAQRQALTPPDLSMRVKDEYTTAVSEYLKQERTSILNLAKSVTWIALIASLASTAMWVLCYSCLFGEYWHVLQAHIDPGLLIDDVLESPLQSPTNSSQTRDESSSSGSGVGGNPLVPPKSG